MKKRERTCIRCGKVEVTFSKAEVCHACHWEVKQAKAAENEKSTLVGLGYEEIDGPVFQQTLHRSWSTSAKVEVMQRREGSHNGETKI